MIAFSVPPLPVFITGGRGVFQKGKKHFHRVYTVYDMLYVQHGTLFMREGEEEFAVGAGGYLILKPGLEHHGFRPCEEDTHYFWLHFTGMEADVPAKEHLQWTDILVKTETFTEPAQYLLRIPQYGRLQNRESGERLMEELLGLNEAISVEEKLQQPLQFYKLLLFLQKEALAIPSAAEKVTEQVVTYIKKHYADNIQIADMAEELHYHADYLARCMQKTMGISPLQYMNEVRLAQAKKLLAGTSAKVKEIAKLVGVQDEAYFSRLFRKREGMSAQEYRRAVQRDIRIGGREDS
ncbi:helix-turn-helix transcriptional regulator [Ectobacillus ponti]|uniref:AraC family transcriptional regulator n=1 Tax=Ectobacillus ponti TaxID=2961894 RepID=A0AA41XA65_9BACI|nr:AraC family transcriptional regulator [Ectobacillus ponti]MCP8968266.1 AraC family transcriptional regulator [Ectobacillus ponti]